MAFVRHEHRRQPVSKATVSWPGGKVVFDNCELGDPRIADELDRLAKLGIQGVSVDFEEDFLP